MKIIQDNKLFVKHESLIITRWNVWKNKNSRNAIVLGCDDYYKH